MDGITLAVRCRLSSTLHKGFAVGPKEPVVSALLHLGIGASPVNRTVTQLHIRIRVLVVRKKFTFTK